MDVTEGRTWVLVVIGYSSMFCCHLLLRTDRPEQYRRVRAHTHAFTTSCIGLAGRRLSGCCQASLVVARFCFGRWRSNSHKLGKQRLEHISQIHAEAVRGEVPCSLGGGAAPWLVRKQCSTMAR